MDQNIAVLSGFRCAPFALLLGIGGTWILGCTSTKPEQVVDTEQTGLKQNIPSRTSQAEHPKQNIGVSCSIETPGMSTLLKRT